MMEFIVHKGHSNHQFPDISNLVCDNS